MPLASYTDVFLDFRTCLLDFGEHYTSIGNISGMDQAINKRKTTLSTTIFSTFDEHNLVNFGPLTKKMTLTYDL